MINTVFLKVITFICFQGTLISYNHNVEYRLECPNVEYPLCVYNINAPIGAYMFVSDNKMDTTILYVGDTVEVLRNVGFFKISD